MTPTRSRQARPARVTRTRSGLTGTTFNFQFPSSVKFSRTTDGGATWSRPVAVDLPAPGFVDQAPRLVVLPDGTLMAVYAQGDLAAGIGRLFVARSLDEGRTWRPPVLAGSQPIQHFFDPETGDEYPQPGFPAPRSLPTAPSMWQSNTTPR